MFSWLFLFLQFSLVPAAESGRFPGPGTEILVDSLPVMG